VAKRDFAPVHPGEILLAEFMRPLGLSAYALANATGMPRTRINDIVLGRRGISADTALRLARYFGTDAQSWLNLQNRYELAVVTEALSDRLEREVKPRAA
jgi:addiction module HigA family antidote